MDEEELTFADYFTKPLLDLVGHPDFSEEAFAIVGEIAKMSTAQIEKLNSYREAN